ncbi:hypothetical protein [Rufibacter ruber]|uniref:hypothetical protein n=1 Tax=Rufibacter ruber TaxID=1783499 RepID=UPI00082D7612|nr:hypothetical protein [Rufibacter ruber]
MQFNITNIANINQNEFKREIHKQLVFEIIFPLPSIGFSSSNIDIISDYAEISFCAESIAPFINIVDAQVSTKDKYYKEFKIKCRATDIDKLTEKLYYYSKIIVGESPDITDLDKISFFDEVSEHEETFSKKTFYFPELINNYWANLINGAYWEMAAEHSESESKFFTKAYRKYPEHRYGFWRSPLTISLKEPVYFSTENWIIPPNTDIVRCLHEYSGLEGRLIIEEADKVCHEGKLILVSNSAAVYFTQFEALRNSISCTERVLEKKLKIYPLSKKETKQLNLFGKVTTTVKSSKKVNHSQYVQIDESSIKYCISEYGDIIIANYKNFHYIFFSYDSLNFEEIKNLHYSLNPIFSKTQNLINLSISGNCDWKELNDNLFEELCYDILYCHPHFDSSTIKKMGKSKSRDGGRDITIKTRGNPTSEPELYIFQCKYYSDDSSLSASKVPNAGNVIMHYGAKGYGVFTSSVIDATLYDMLDGFKDKMRIDTSFTWSKYELERLLNRNTFLKNKYFKKN